MKRTVFKVIGLLSLLLLLSSCDFVLGLLGMGGGGGPSAPMNVIALPGDGQVTVSWSSVSGASSYIVYYGQGSSVMTNSPTKQMVNSSPCIVQNLTNGVPYAFIVTASDSSGESGASQVVTATPNTGAGNSIAISGTITRDSSVTQTGTIKVGLLNYLPAQDATSYTWVTGISANPLTLSYSQNPIPFSFTGVLKGSYFVGAWMDVNGNQAFDPGEPGGAFPNPADSGGQMSLYNFQSDYTGISLVLSAGGQVVVDFAPPVPTVSAQTSTSITLSWSAVNDPSGTPALKYQVFRSATQAGTYNRIATVTTLTYTDSALQSGQSMWYKLKALFDDADATLSSFSTAVNGIATSASFAAPTNFVTTGQTSYSIALQWDYMQGATKYELFRDVNQSFSSPFRVFSGQGTSFTDDDASLTAGATYWYRVKAYYQNGASPYAAAVSTSLTTAVTTVPNPPTTIYLTPTTNTLVLSWDPSPGAATYVVYKVMGTVSNQIGTTSSTSYTDSGLIADTNYYYQISAVNSFGPSAKSAIVTGKTLPSGVTTTAPATPTGLTVSNTATSPGSSLAISWTASVGVDVKYVLYRDNMYNGAFSNQVTETAMTSFTDMNLSSGTTYYYKVKAGISYVNAGQTYWLWSGLSASQNGTTQTVVVNQQPYAPSYPNPITGTTAMDPMTITSLGWDNPGDPEGDALTFDLFVGATGTNLFQKLSYSQQTYWTPPAGFFSYNTSYSWYVVVHDPTHATIGPTWTFSTMAPPANSIPPSVNFWITSYQQTYVTGTSISLSSTITSNNIPATTPSGTWLLEKPNADSNASLTAINWTTVDTTNSFTPDMPGYYYVYLTGTDGTASATNWLSVYVVPPTQGTTIINLQ